MNWGINSVGGLFGIWILLVQKGPGFRMLSALFNFCRFQRKAAIRSMPICMDMAYTTLPPDLKKKMDGLKCIYDNDLNSLFNFQLDADGFTRPGPFPTPKEED